MHNNLELDELFKLKSSLEYDIENFFDGEPSPNYGDMGYQRLLSNLDDTQEKIEALAKEVL